MKLIAEIGWNHVGDMSLAKEMVCAAKESGADYAKFQTWSVSKLCNGPWDQDGRRQIYEKAELTPDKHALLKSYCDEKRIKFLTSCFSETDISLIRRFTSEVKIPSPEVMNAKLMNQALEEFDLLHVSTGAIDVKDFIEYSQNPKVVLLHCVSSYPCQKENINFPKMDFLKKICDKVGYSGHMPSIDDAIVAICKDACVIEKHFTINHDLPGRDNKFALLPHEFKKIRDFSDSYNLMNKNCGHLGMQDCENNYRVNQAGRWNHPRITSGSIIS